KDGFAFTLDMLGDVCVNEAEAVGYQQHYLALLDDLTQRVAVRPTDAFLETESVRWIPHFNLSFTLSSLASQLEPMHHRASVAILKERVRPILAKARALGAFITFDMENYELKDITLDVFRELLVEEAFVDWPDVGIAMQAYLRDTPHDLAQLTA